MIRWIKKRKRSNREWEGRRGSREGVVAKRNGAWERELHGKSRRAGAGGRGPAAPRSSFVAAVAMRQHRMLDCCYAMIPLSPSSLYGALTPLFHGTTKQSLTSLDPCHSVLNLLSLRTRPFCVYSVHSRTVNLSSLLSLCSRDSSVDPAHHCITAH